MDWVLLCGIAQGYEYEEIAVILKVTVGGLRVRLLRLRRSSCGLVEPTGNQSTLRLAVFGDALRHVVLG
jgi:hypothetical protein